MHTFFCHLPFPDPHPSRRTCAITGPLAGIPGPGEEIPHVPRALGARRPVGGCGIAVASVHVEVLALVWPWCGSTELPTGSKATLQPASSVSVAIWVVGAWGRIIRSGCRGKGPLYVSDHDASSCGTCFMPVDRPPAAAPRLPFPPPRSRSRCSRGTRSSPTAWCSFPTSSRRLRA
eukprot:364948-Chlamydomonas_euryale.AAC.15